MTRNIVNKLGGDQMPLYNHLKEFRVRLGLNQQQMGARIENNEMDMIIYLRDPLNPKSHEPNVFDIISLCDIHNIPIATNLATAEVLLLALDRGDLDWRNVIR